MWSGTRGLLVISFLTGLGLATEPECRANGPKVNSGKPSMRGAVSSKNITNSTGTALWRKQARPHKTLVPWARYDSGDEPFFLAGEILARGPAASAKAYSILAGFENGWLECHMRVCQRQLTQP